MTFKIISDSSCDLDKETLKNLDVKVLRIKGTDEKGEDLPEDLTNKEIYKRMREGAFFKTSQLTYYDYFKEFEESAKEGKDIIALTLSSGLSGTYQNACMAKREIEEKYDIRVEVVDSLAASVGFG